LGRRRDIALFVACWIVCGAHFATNIVREHYPAFALAERGTLRVDPYLGLHDDIFAIEGRGAFINNNPGASMIGAVPYALVRPLVDAIVERVSTARRADGSALTADYDHPRADYREYFRKVRAQGLDVRFGIAAAVMQLLVMAPLTAASVVVMARVLETLGFPPQSVSWLALLYGFGTPVFFRTGFLNQNLLVADFAFFSFALLLPGAARYPSNVRLAAAGALAGSTLLCDYTGLVLVPALTAYAIHRARERESSAGAAAAIVQTWPMLAGAIPPIAALLAYQAWAFGNPLLPAQSYMPPAEYGAVGWNGFTAPDPELLWANLFDVRFGLLVAAPLLVLACAALFVRGVTRRYLKRGEEVFIWLTCACLWLFASSTQFARLQWETGVRYLIPAVPLLFLPAAALLVVMPRVPVCVVAVLAVVQSWCLAMVRADPLASIATVLAAGPQLPWLTTLGRMGSQYGRSAGWLASHQIVVVAPVAAVAVVLWYRGVRGAVRV
jgi:hypothetical protein